MSPRKPLAGERLAVIAALLLCAAACRQDMHDQAKVEPLEASALFDNGSSARPFPANTVARGQLRADRPFFSGLNADGTFVARLPLQLDRALLERGRERYEIYCTPCHDRTGSGRGMIVQRGFKQPPSYAEERLRAMPIGYFYDVITKGYATMSGYAAQIPPRDRWAIAAYIRVLQLSQHAPIDALSEDDLEALHGGGADQGAEEHG